MPSTSLRWANILIGGFLAGCSDTTLVKKPEHEVEILDGSISGRVCDPSGRTWLVGATAYVNLVDENGVVLDTRLSTTDQEGRWSLTDLPGDTEYTLYVQYGIDILDTQAIWVASGDSVELEEPDCFDPLSIEIAIVTGSYDNFDVVLTPTTAGPPPRVGTFDGLGSWRTDTTMAALCPYAWPWNVLGWPGVNVPAGFTRDGLPLGAQLLGPTCGEERLISLAAQLEDDRHWHRERPPLDAAEEEPVRE